MRWSIYIIPVILIGCAGLGSITRTNNLRPGMNDNQVREILGDPIQTQFISNNWVWKYSLHEYWKGYEPFYAVFNKETKKLDSWFVNENEFQQERELWLKAMPAEQREKIDLTIK